MSVINILREALERRMPGVWVREYTEDEYQRALDADTSGKSRMGFAIMWNGTTTFYWVASPDEALYKYVATLAPAIFEAYRV